MNKLSIYLRLLYNNTVTVQWSLYFATLYFKTALIIRPSIFVTKCDFVYYFKTTCSIRPHFHGPMRVCELDGSLYFYSSLVQYT